MKKQKILVFAHVPPPHHGQSVMVQVLLEGLRADPRFEVYHVDARVSDDIGDIGSFRPQKFIRLLLCILQAWQIRLCHGRMAFYYVPAPAKKSAIMRDWVVMALCRPFFPELILHWHSYGLGEWASKGNDWRRRITRLALGKADLSIVLNNYNKRDAGVFAPKCIEVVANGIVDEFPDYETSLASRRENRAAALKALGVAAGNESRITGQAAAALQPVRFLFLGHLIESKGVFVAIDATALANAQLRKANAAWRANLTLAGSFASEKEKAQILAAIDRANEAVGEEGPCVLLAGFLDSGEKKSALEKADCLVFPTFYENEAQPLVLLEAMSAGLPVITTSWRGVPEVLPEFYPAAVEPESEDALARALLDPHWRVKGGALRHHYQARFTVPIHVAKLSEVLSGSSANVLFRNYGRES